MSKSAKGSTRRVFCVAAAVPLLVLACGGAAHAQLSQFGNNLQGDQNYVTADYLTLLAS